MKIAAIVIGLACAGLVGALASGSLTDPAPPTTLGPADESKLARRVEVLESQIDRMKSELEVVRASSTRPAPVPDAHPSEAPKSREIPAPDAVVASMADSRLRETVLSVLEERAQEQRAAKAKKMEEASAEREARMLDKMQEKLGLTPDQRTQLQDILARRREAISALPREERRQKEREIRATYATEIQALIGEEAYETFQKRFSPARRGGGRNPKRGDRGNR